MRTRNDDPGRPGVGVRTQGAELRILGIQADPTALTAIKNMETAA